MINRLNLHRVHESREPIHDFFGLTYASYLVLPRTMLQSAPVEWQQRFVKQLQELDELFGHHAIDGSYSVQFRDPGGRFIDDPLKDYERGRRRIDARQ